jgi:DDE superfamily endonuclease
VYRLLPSPLLLAASAFQPIGHTTGSSKQPWLDLDQPTMLPPAQARAMRVEHEYKRGGAVAYLAAWDVHRAKLFGRCEPTTGIAAFHRLVDQVMGQEPYASAKRVFWVVDNGSSHRGQAAIRRLVQQWPTAQLVHTPVHASWLNQVEIYLSMVQRKCLTPMTCQPGHGPSAPAGLRAPLRAGANPFEWRLTRDDLALLLKRLADKQHRPPTSAQRNT